jgi:protein-disulfide isomerase
MPAKKTTKKKAAPAVAAAPTYQMPPEQYSGQQANYESPYSLSSTIAFINNNFALILLAGIIFIGGFFSGSLWTENELLKSGGAKVAGNAAAPSAPTPAGAAPVAPPAPVDQIPEITDDDHIRGNKNAKVILVEYSDFECPFCARFHPTIAQVAEENDDVAWVYRHYPLSFHANAQKAAEGSECVADLVGEDAFWTYSDALAETTSKNGTLTPDDIEAAATAAGVNIAAFNTCLDSGKMAEIVTAHAAGGTAAGVTGTPGTIVVTKDGGQELIPGALPLPQVEATVANYL